MQEEMKRLREELQEQHEAELSALRSDLEKALEEEKEKLKALQAALDNDESKMIFFERITWVVSRMSL